MLQNHPLPTLLAVLFTVLLAPPTPALAEDQTVRVVTIDRAGAPVAEALVSCDATGSGTAPRSDARGEARLEGPCARVRCEKNGFLPGEAPVVSGTARCTLRPAVTIVGALALAPCGEGCVASARLRGGETPLAQAPVSPKRRFEDGGAFTLGPLPEGDLVVRVARGGWACEAEIGPTRAGRAQVTVPWREPQEISVRVEDADGKPVSGIPLRVHQRTVQDPRSPIPPQRALGTWRCAPLSPVVAPTDASGKAAVSVDPAHPALIVAGTWDDPRGVDAAVVAAASDERLTLVPALPARVTARVVHQDGRPARCEAHLHTSDPLDLELTAALGGALVAPCGADGSLALGPVRASRVWLDARPAGGLPLMSSQLAAAPGAALDFGTLRVDPGLAFAVAVIDADGVPIEGARVQARGRAGLILDAEATTDAGGVARIAGLPPGSQVMLTVSARGHVTRRESLAEVPAEGAAQVVLERGAVWEGVVVDPAGERVAGATLVAERGGRPADKTTADDAGGFALLGIPPGMVSLRVTAPGFATLVEPPAEVLAGDEVPGIQIVLEPLPRMAGVVVDPDGDPVSGARVRLVAPVQLGDPREGTQLASTFSDGQGRFSLPLAADDGPMAVAEAAGFAPAIDPDPATHPDSVRLVLSKPATLVARIPSARENDAIVSVTDGLGIGHSARATGERSVRLTGLAPGKATARLAGGPGRAVDLAPGATSEVSLTMGATLDVTVVDRSGAGVPRAVVSASPLDDPSLPLAALEYGDESGRARLTGLAAGRFVVIAETELGRAEQRLAIAEDEEIPLTLRAEPIDLLVTVLGGSDGPPLPGAQVQIFEAEAIKSGTRPRAQGVQFFPVDGRGLEMSVSNVPGDFESTGADGTALLRVSQSGAYQLRVAAEGYGSLTRVVEMAPGMQAAVVALEPEGDVGSVTVDVLTDPPNQFGQLYCRDARGGEDRDYVSTTGVCGDLAPGPAVVLFQVRGYGSVRETVIIERGKKARATLIVPRGGTVVVPVATLEAERPALLDAEGFDWSAAYGRLIQPEQNGLWRKETRPDAGPAWVFTGLPPGAYTAVVGGTSRGPVSIDSGETAVVP